MKQLKWLLSIQMYVVHSQQVSQVSHTLLTHFQLLSTLKVKTVRDENGIVVDFETEGDFPRYGNDDDRADEIAVWLLKTFMAKIKKCHTYRNSGAYNINPYNHIKRCLR